MNCTKQCREDNNPCLKKTCRHWMEYEKDLNCSIIAVEDNGPMTLEQVSERLGMTLVGVKQIQDDALLKVKKRILPLLNE